MSARDWARSLAGTTEHRAISYQSVWGSGGTWADGLGPTISVSAEAALGVPALLACVDTIAGQISAMPLQTFRRTPTIREQIADNPLVAAPSTLWAPDEWVYVAVASMLLHGEAIGIITKATTGGDPLEIEWVDPRRVRVDLVEGRRRYQTETEIVPTDRVFHVHHGVLLAGGVRGRSPISFLANPIRAGLESIAFELDWFKNGAHPSGVLSVDTPELPEAAADALVNRFMAKTRARKPVALAKIATYHQIQSTPEASGLDAARKRVATDIANVFHIPPEMVGGETGSLTYKNLEMDQAVLDLRALMPVYVRLERALSRLLPDGQFVRFNADFAVRTDLRTRAEVGEILVRSGQRTTDEVRAKDDMPPLVSMSADLARKLQQMYLAVGVILTPDEAREILNREGAGLVVPGPDTLQGRGVVPVEPGEDEGKDGAT